MEELDRLRALRVHVREFIHVGSVSLVRGHAARGGVRLEDEFLVFQSGHVVADRSGAHAEFVAHDNRVGADRFAGVDEMLDDGFENFLFAVHGFGVSTVKYTVPGGF